MNMNFKRKLPIPMDIKAEYPLPSEYSDKKKAFDADIKSVLSGESDKLIVIIGPCSADREAAVLTYLEKLKKLSERISDKILIIPRVYTNKPRTTGDGYKGMLHQPDPSVSPDMLKGLIGVRLLHLKAIEETEFFCADELLYTENHRYLSDLLSYVAVGARSVENQEHRLVASGLDIPVGMKNPTSGDLSVMLNSITAAQHPHTFIYRGWEVESTGNKYTHAILRGYVNKHGESIHNYHYEDLSLICKLYSERELENPAVIIDTNHSNSGKQYLEQVRIAKEVIHSRRHSEDILKLVKGLMIESYLEDGQQSVDGCVFGRSITDPCLGWDKTERLLLELSDLI